MVESVTRSKRKTVTTGLQNPPVINSCRTRILEDKRHEISAASTQTLLLRAEATTQCRFRQSQPRRITHATHHYHYDTRTATKLPIATEQCQECDTSHADS
ncbi:hypothetical protein M758_3G202900 [Ceratodon purpureus]|nr:hypothetical protein M758_3G202900 [Ceratodon purpureus]